jgi:hypothetical protein
MIKGRERKFVTRHRLPQEDSTSAHLQSSLGMDRSFRCKKTKNQGRRNRYTYTVPVTGVAWLTIISRDSREVVITVSLSSLKKSNMVLMR